MSTPKENVTEPPNFEPSPSGYNQTHDDHSHDQYQSSNIEHSVSYGHDQSLSNAGQSALNTDQTNNPPVSEPPTVQNTDSQNSSNQVSTQNEPVTERQENIPESKPEPSVFDLLSDIDFTVEQKPLMPQIKVPQISENAIIRPAVVPKVEPVKKPPPKEEVIERPAKKNLFSDPSLLNKFTQEVKNLQKFTDSLTNTAAGGLTVLDAKWNKFQDIQVSSYIILSRNFPTIKSVICYNSVCLSSSDHWSLVRTPSLRATGEMRRYLLLFLFLNYTHYKLMHRIIRTKSNRRTV